MGGGASPSAGGATQAPVELGRITGVFGVRGWVKVYSDTRPREAILGYNPWLLGLNGGWREWQLLDGRVHGAGIVAQLAGCSDRDQAQALIGARIAVRREQLPRVRAGEFYWADLVGLQVVNLRDEALGVVDHLMETGANDVIVVRGERERLIPFTKAVITAVDLEHGVIRVDWDRDD